MLDVSSNIPLSNILQSLWCVVHRYCVFPAELVSTKARCTIVCTVVKCLPKLTIAQSVEHVSVFAGCNVYV